MRPRSAASPLPCPAYILAGGQSRRFGRDKARVSLGAQPLILRLREQLEACGHRAQVIADGRERYADLGIDSIEDAFPGCGPLGGLVAALQHRQNLLGDGWLLVLNCDLVTWHADWSVSLLSQAKDVALAAMLPLSATSARITQPPIAQGQCIVQAILSTASRSRDKGTRDKGTRDKGTRDKGNAGGENSSFSTTRTAQPLPALYHTSVLHVACEHARSGRLALFELLAALQTIELSLVPEPLDYSFNTPEELARAEDQLRLGMIKK